jgi:hypothetical protein
LFWTLDVHYHFASLDGVLAEGAGFYFSDGAFATGLTFYLDESAGVLAIL